MVQHLPEGSAKNRFEFARDFLAFLQTNKHVEDFIFFSDEAHFHLSGKVNKQNDRIYAVENPHATRPSFLHQQRVTVWAAMSGRRLLGPFFFHDNINSESYLDMLRDYAIPQLREGAMCTRDQWFQQDGARPHTTQTVLNFLNLAFGGHVVSNRFPETFQTVFKWPPYSPDLNPPDFFLWGYLKSKVYTNEPQNLADLMHNICKEMKEIPEDMLKKTIQNFKNRLALVKKAHGGHIENFLK